MSQHEETTGFGVSRVMDRDIQLNIRWIRVTLKKQSYKLANTPPERTNIQKGKWEFDRIWYANYMILIDFVCFAAVFQT